MAKTSKTQPLSCNLFKRFLESWKFGNKRPLYEVSHTVTKSPRNQNQNGDMMRNPNFCESSFILLSKFWHSGFLPLDIMLVFYTICTRFCRENSKVHRKHFNVFSTDAKFALHKHDRNVNRDSTLNINYAPNFRMLSLVAVATLCWHCWEKKLSGIRICFML